MIMIRVCHSMTLLNFRESLWAYGNESVLLVIVVFCQHDDSNIAGLVGKFDIAAGHRSRLSSSSELRTCSIVVKCRFV